MKPKKKNKPTIKETTRTINILLIILESAREALNKKHNFNLAEVLISEYYQKIPQKIVDEYMTKAILDSLRERNTPLLASAIETEIERLRTIKIKQLITKTIQS